MIGRRIQRTSQGSDPLMAPRPDAKLGRMTTVEWPRLQVSPWTKEGVETMHYSGVLTAILSAAFLSTRRRIVPIGARLGTPRAVTRNSQSDPPPALRYSDDCVSCPTKVSRGLLCR